MYRSDEEAAIQRADALQRELDESRVETETIQRELTATQTRLAIVEQQDPDELRQEIARLSQEITRLSEETARLSEELVCTKDLLASSERERQRLSQFAPKPHAKAKVQRHANSFPAKRQPVDVITAMIVVIIVIAVVIAKH